MQPKYSIIIPAYNEQEVLGESYKRIKAVMETLDGPYEMIFVDDGSRDDTLKLLTEMAEQNECVKVLSFSRNFGHQIAVSAGLDNASGRAIIIIDCDLQDPPEVIPEMVKKWKEGYDVVYGKRLKRAGESIFKRITAKVYYRVLKMMSASKIPLDTGDFRLIDKKVRDAICAMPEKSRFLRGMVSWAGFKQTPVEYMRDARWAGETKYPLSKMIKLAGDGITSFSSKPLGIATKVGIGLCFLTALYAVVSLILAWCGVLITPWIAYVFAALGFLIGLISVFIGILGIYIGRIFDEAKSRPLYFIGQKINFEKEEKDDR